MTKTLFMIHGMQGAAWIWDNYKTYFEANSYRCVTPTLRYHRVGHDKPPDPRLGTLSVNDYADDLEKEISSLKEKPIVIGHSMGGLLAQKLAERNLAKMAVLVTPAAPADVSVIKYSSLRSLAKPLLRWGFWKRPFMQTEWEFSYAIMNLSPKAERKKVYKRLCYESGRAAMELGFPFLDKHRAAHVDETRVRCPMLAISGDKDKTFPPSIVKKIARKYGADYVNFPNHSHWIFRENGWEEVAAYILEWIDKTR